VHLNACDCVRHQVAVLSGGEKRRVALARLLLENHDMLLLDEPTNHLDAQSVAWLQTYLNDFPGTVVAITHDRYFLEETCKWILELERGEGKPDCMPDCLPHQASPCLELERGEGQPDCMLIASLIRQALRGQLLRMAGLIAC
jgi:ABC-type sulfate/molybdate transport systems ATPase subunit